jgi:3-hydroxyisobutyrate dehydrogenase-like beta-hydroxyacid dehydrogenase
MTKAAVIGTGRMGGAMARTLARANFELVLWNRSGDKARSVAADIQADVAATPREAATNASVVVCSLADDDAVRATYGGSDGLIAGLESGSVVLETSTVDPQTIRDLAPQIDAVGAVLLDAPVSGSVQLVEEGKLTVMVGGPDQGLESARPVLDALAARVFHVAEIGAGATMKLAVNGVVHALNVAVSEALVLAEKSGIDRAAAYDILAASAAGAPFVQYKRAAFENPDAAPVAFSLDLAAKDLSLITALAARAGAPMEQARVNHAIARRAAESGLGNHDMSAVAQFLRST